MNRKFNEDIESLFSGNIDEYHVFELGSPGAILREAGLENRPIQVLKGTIRGKTEYHHLKKEHLLNLPKAINDPIFVRKSDRMPKTRLTVFTEIIHPEGNMLVILDINEKHNYIEINKIVSAYGKRADDIAEWINSEKGFTYINKEKSLSWLRSSRGSNSPSLSKITKAIDKINESVGLSSTKFAEARNLIESKNKQDVRYRLSNLYHGSGAIFDRFNLDYISTGEGAQAFGWGIYLTELKGVAKNFAEAEARNARIET